jgi:hypothetical protein
LLSTFLDGQWWVDLRCIVWNCFLDARQPREATIGG